MSESKVVKQVGILEKLFSYDGTFNRLNYLVYGLAMPGVFVIGGIYLLAVSQYIGIAMMVLALPVFVAATVKRANDRKDSSVLMVVGSFIPYLGFLIMLYLLLAPSRKVGNEPKQYGFKHILIGLGVLIGVLAITSFVLRMI